MVWYHAGTMPGLSSLLRTITTSWLPRSTGAARHRHRHHHRQRCKTSMMATETFCRSSSSTSIPQNPPLAYEWIVDGQVVVPSDQRNAEVHERYDDREVIVFLHGLLGDDKVRPLLVEGEILTVSPCASSL